MASLSASAFAALFRPGMRVFVAGSSGEPRALVGMLQQFPQAAAGVTFIQFPLPGLNTTDFAALDAAARMETFFLTPALSASHAAGKVRFVPMQLRRIYDYLATGPRFDLALISAGPLNEKGRYPLAPNADFISAVVGNCETLVAEVNSQLVSSPTMVSMAPQRIDHQVECAHDVPAQAPAAVDDVAAQIGRHVAALVNDGDCIQIGIGAIPAAVLAALEHKNDLGIHSGLIDCAVAKLVQRGVINGSRKNSDRGLHVTAMAIGDAEFYRWVGHTDAVTFRSIAYTHEYLVLRDIENFVSINSALEVDLYGQVNAEMLGSRQLSGTGGSVDFMRGAAVAKNGRSVVALPATARGGQQSRIVPALSAGSAATAARTDIDRVVTEFGVAQLAARSVDERAAALIEVAHPQFRDELRERWRELQHVGR